MQLTPIITFRGINSHAALKKDIRERLDKLETYGSITSCRVLVEFAQRHHETGNRYHVRIDLTRPGQEIVVAHEAGLHGSAKHLGSPALAKQDEPDPERRHAHVAVREAFDIVRRRLQDRARRQRGAVKARRAVNP